MDTLTEPLADLAARAQRVLGEAISGAVLQGVRDEDVAGILAHAATVHRLVEALLVETVGEVVRRSTTPMIDERMTSRLGCHDVSELVQRATRVSRQSATRLERAARAVRPAVSATTGELLAAEMPELRGAMLDGAVGIDGILAIAVPLSQTAPRVSAAARLTAEAILVAEARGDGPDGAPPPCADLLRLQATAWATALDQDGAEPRDREAQRKRGIALGTPTSVGVPIRGMLLPEVAAQLQQIFDAHLSPRVAFAPTTEVPADARDADEPHTPLPDHRTRTQKQHDALASALAAAASSRLLPTIGGAAPTLVVSITHDDIVSGHGAASAQGCDTPLSVDTARHIACAGVIQRVTSTSDGRVIRIGTEERVFNRHQRRAIALRDGGCVIPGCGVPAGWCEIHHVTEHAHGGPTHTDNGVLVCWYHHRHLGKSGWRIRMNHGIPEIQAPAWHDPTRKWRPATTSPTRLTRSLLART